MPIPIGILFKRRIARLNDEVGQGTRRTQPALFFYL
jgi:hypothetical protein